MEPTAELADDVAAASDEVIVLDPVRDSVVGTLAEPVAVAWLISLSKFPVVPFGSV